MPAAEVEVSADLVRLLADQHPDLARLPVEFLANGWDNELYRVGDELVARLPRRALGAQIITDEQRWLPGLAPGLPLPIPYPERTGVPAAVTRTPGVCSPTRRTCPRCRPAPSIRPEPGSACPGPTDAPSSYGSTMPPDRRDLYGRDPGARPAPPQDGHRRGSFRPAGLLGFGHWVAHHQPGPHRAGDLRRGAGSCHGERGALGERGELRGEGPEGLRQGRGYDDEGRVPGGDRPSQLRERGVHAEIV